MCSTEPSESPDKHAKEFSTLDAILNTLKKTTEIKIMHYIWQKYKSEDSMPWQMQHACNVIVFSCIYLLSYVGRPGSWQDCSWRQSKKASILVQTCSLLKSRRWTGCMRRWVVPGCMRGFPNPLGSASQKYNFFSRTCDDTVQESRKGFGRRNEGSTKCEAHG